MAVSAIQMISAARLASSKESSVKPLTEGDILLLRAALLDGDAALSAYVEWRRHLDLATITPQWTKMLPLLQYNLSRLGVADALIERARGVRRYIWVNNLNSMTMAQRGFKALQDAGIPTIVFKGVAIIVCFLRDRSLRPMDDIDILVPYDRFAEAVSALDVVGIRPVGSGQSLIEQVHRRSDLIGWPFRGDKCDIDVHWHAMPWNRQRNADEEFWNGSRAVEIDGTTLRVFDPADQFLHLCAHAIQPGSNTSLRWVSDAVHAVRASGSQFSWRRVLREAARHRVSLIMADSLRFLRQVVDLPVPDDIVAGLERQATFTERMERRFAIRARKGKSGLASRQFLEFRDFRRGPQGAAAISTANALSRFVKEKYSAGSLAQAAVTAMYEVANRPRNLRCLLSIGHHYSADHLAHFPTLADELTFIGHNRFEATFVRGWSFPETTGRWTAGHEARLAWRLNKEANDLICRIELMPALCEAHPRMDAEIWANDVLAAEWQFLHDLPSPAVRFVAIPAKALRGRHSLTLSFVVHQLMRPASVGHSQDERELGLHVRALTFAPQQELKLSSVNLNGILAAGWHPIESWGVWSSQTKSVLRLPLRGKIGRPATVEVNGRVCGPEQGSASTVVFRIVGGAATVVTTEPGNRDVVGSFAIMPHDVRVDRDVLLEIEIDRLCSQVAEGLAADERSLGFGIERLVLTQSPSIADHYDTNLPPSGDS